MRLLCLFGLHRWLTRPTARPNTTVSRCRTCNTARVHRPGRDLRSR